MANPKRIKVLRDRHLSTTAIYPKQIEQSLPEDIKPVEIEPESYIPTGDEPTAQYITIGDTVYKIDSSGGTTVVANPTLAGTEDDLTGLQVGDTKYKVPSGTTQEQANWNESDTNSPAYIKNKPSIPDAVVANPTLAGTEADLTGLQVGSTKYAIPTGLQVKDFISSPIDLGNGNVHINKQPDNINDYFIVFGYVYTVGSEIVHKNFMLLLKYNDVNSVTEINSSQLSLGGDDIELNIDLSGRTTDTYCTLHGSVTSSVNNYEITVTNMLEIVNI